jgi:membrane-bound lytic murein transglycosylase B
MLRRWAQRAGFQAYLPQLRAQAQAAGVSQRTIDSAFSNMTFSPRTIELDQAQPGGVARETRPFRRSLRTSASMSARTSFSGGRAATLQTAPGSWTSAAATASSPRVMAIYGHETSYGAVTGNFDLLNSLASLAYEGRRRQLFTDEFIATLKMMDRGYSRSQLKGSWAGATGYPQFLPSVYCGSASTATATGARNIWSSEPDALASIANYLAMPAGSRTCAGAFQCVPTFSRAALGTPDSYRPAARGVRRHTRAG